MKTYVYADQISKLRKIEKGDFAETENLEKNPENETISKRNNFIDAITDKKDNNTFDGESNDDRNDKMFNEIEELVEKIDFSSSTGCLITDISHITKVEAFYAHLACNL